MIVGKGQFDNFDLSLLTPEQVQQFTDEAAKVGLTLAQLIDKKNELTGKLFGAKRIPSEVTKQPALSV